MVPRETKVTTDARDDRETEVKMAPKESRDGEDSEECQDHKDQWDHKERPA